MPSLKPSLNDEQALRSCAGGGHRPGSDLRYVKKNASLEMADRVVSVIREKFIYLAGRPGGGHLRRDLTDEPVKFFSVYSYLIVYRPETSPLQVVAILHGRCDVEELLKDRL